MTAIIYRAFYGSTLGSVMISDDESVKAFADKVFTDAVSFNLKIYATVSNVLVKSSIKV